MKATCPKDKTHKTFVTVAHVTQDWIVDEHGNFIEEVKTVEVIEPPNVDNIWTCATCGEEAIVED